jgi:CheY-like chemotaxis protein
VSAVTTTAEILIVEDDAVILNTLAYNLIRQGFVVQKATSGAEALKLARKVRPDLILLDVMLPGESGIRVCEKIREEDWVVVIVMITAKDAEEEGPGLRGRGRRLRNQAFWHEGARCEDQRQPQAEHVLAGDAWQDS